MERISNLAEGWGVHPVNFDRKWMDLSKLPLDLSVIDKLLREMPASNVFVRVTSADPANSNIKRLTLAEVPDLVTKLESGAGNIHLQAIQLDEHLPVYRQFKQAFIDKVSNSVPVFNPELLRHSSVGLFVSTPGATAPFHADPEHNFLLQVIGEKVMHSFPPMDFETFPSEARELLASDKLSMLKTYVPEFEERAIELDLQPGDLIYHPPMSPHWVRTGSKGFSLSYTISLVTPDVEQTLLLHKLNRKLRKVGLTPSQEGLHPVLDKLKIDIASTGKKLKHLFVS
ncbi:cupin-like domain-containing protein [Aliiglaciecola litoralis]|uniref:JmjC domain-containing protein n=1 Tax=Aliiglaciecola litoralis TaxID=582857 RepID=A0ABN1LID5_9ALTE